MSIRLKVFQDKEVAQAKDKHPVWVDFLYKHLGEFGDQPGAILKAIEYIGKKGGMLVEAYTEEEQLVGVAVVNRTGMDEYIPANILVYVAVDASQRGKGIGRQIITFLTGELQGGIALHVEPHNPAKRLYERLGFTNKYLEMRFQK